MTKALQDVQKADIARTLPGQEQNPTSLVLASKKGSLSSKTAQGGEKALAAELAEEGNEVLKQLKEQQREVIDSLDLKQ